MDVLQQKMEVSKKKHGNILMAWQITPMDLLIPFEFLNDYSIIYLKVNIFKYINFFSAPVSELAFSIFPRIISMVSSNWLVPK